MEDKISVLPSIEEIDPLLQVSFHYKIKRNKKKLNVNQLT